MTHFLQYPDTLTKEKTMSRRPLLAGNWKMFKTLPETVDLLKKLAPAVADVRDRDVVVCPPFTSLAAAVDALRGSVVRVGAQNMSENAEGAFTGEISGPMLRAVGVDYVILGHSERRQYHAESDALINKKLHKALKDGLTPILCVGETLAQRESNATFDVVSTQLLGGLASVEAVERVVVAYEPVWAIGTGKVATPAQAQEVHAFVRAELRKRFGASADAVRVLYGGSVKPDNIDVLMAQPDIDGALVGGASLKADDFARIVRFQSAAVAG